LPTPALYEGSLTKIPGKFEFKCNYNSTYTIYTSTELEINGTPRKIFGENETGIFNFNLDLYSSYEYDSKLKAEDEINVGEKAFFGIQAENFPESLSFLVQKCSIEEIETSSSFDIVSSPGCNNAITSTSSPDPIITSGAEIKRFEFQSFTFTSSEKAIAREILKCEILVCLKDECADPFCDGNNGSSVRRRRNI